MAQIEYIFWYGNSPDLNAIEPIWFWLKKQTIRKGAPISRAEAVKIWEQK